MAGQLSDLEKDTIAEVGNISLGAAANALSVILDHMVDITTPRLEMTTVQGLRKKYVEPCVLVDVEYTSGLEGHNILLVREADALVITAMMMGEDHRDRTGPLGEMEFSALQEAMNQMIGAMATAMSDLFQRSVQISPPHLTRVNLERDYFDFPSLDEDSPLVHVQFSMVVPDLINSTMVQIVSLDFAREMTGHLLGPYASEGTAGTGPPSPGKEEEAAGPGEEAPSPADSYSATTGPRPDDMELDAIAEVGNISLGASATALSTLLNRGVEITTPRLEVVPVSQIQEKYPVPCLLVEVEYTTGLQGKNMLLVKEKDAKAIAALMMGQEEPPGEEPLGEIELSAVQEAMNQMMGAMATAMSELFQRTIDISPPTLEPVDLGEDLSMLNGFSPEEEVVHVEFSITVEDLFDSVMIQVIPLAFAAEMAGYLLQGFSGDVAAGESAVAGEETPPGQPKKIVFEPAVKGPEPAPAAPRRAAPGRGAPLADLEKLELVKDIPMDIVVVLGSARISLDRLFTLEQGGIIDLDCGENDPVELLANDRLLARGEVVMIRDQLGVRITEIQFEEVADSYGA